MRGTDYQIEAAQRTSWASVGGEEGGGMSCNLLGPYSYSYLFPPKYVGILKQQYIWDPGTLCCFIIPTYLGGNLR